MSNSYRINSKPIGRVSETLGEAQVRQGEMDAILRRLDDEKYSRPAEARRFAPNGVGATYTLSPSGVIWATGGIGISIQTVLSLLSFRDLMGLIAAGRVREVTHEEEE